MNIEHGKRKQVLGAGSQVPGMLGTMINLTLKMSNLECKISYGKA